MMRVEELTLKLLDENIGSLELKELTDLLATDPHAVKIHIALVEQEAILRGERSALDLTQATIKRLEAEKSQEIVQGVLKIIKEQRGPTMASTEKTRVKPRRTLIPSSDEVGLTARIKRKLLYSDLNITDKISSTLLKLKEENHFFQGLHRAHYGIFAFMLFLIFFMGFFALRSQNIQLRLKYPNGVTIRKPVSIAAFQRSKQIAIPSYQRQINYKRVDVYGHDLGPNDFVVSQKGKVVEDKYNLFPGNYTIRIKKPGFTPIEIPMTVGDSNISIAMLLEPLSVVARRLKIYLHDPLSPIQKLAPDDVVLANNGKSIKDVPVKPGNYIVRISKKGYHPKEAKIYVNEAGEVAEKITLEHKKRPTHFLIKSTSEEKMLLPQDMILLQEGKRISYDNNLLFPGAYDLLVNRNGYRKHKQRVTITPGESLLSLPIFLETKPRAIVVKPNYNIVPPDIAPDKAFLRPLWGENKQVIPITPGLKVAPGRYWATIEKAGYFSHTEEIAIEPGNDVFETKAHLISSSRLIYLALKSDFELDKNIIPDDLWMDILANKRGYKAINWGKEQKSLPKEQNKAHVTIFLETLPRKVIAQLECDYPKGTTRADSITLTKIIGGQLQKTTRVTPTQTFKPGRFLLKIEKAGYASIEEEIIIYPDNKDYVIRKKLQALHPELFLEIDSDYDPGKRIKPDKIELDRKEIIEGSRLSPGKHQLVLIKAGYHPLKKSILISPGKEPFIYKGQLKAKLRSLRFEIQRSGSKTTFLPNFVEIEGNKVKEGDLIPPKKLYNFKIVKKGFNTLTLARPIEPSEDEYILKAIMMIKKRTVILTVLATYPKGKELFADKCYLGNAPLKKEAFIEPGEHQLVITKAGYKTISKVCKIGPAEEPFFLKERMQPKPRKVILDIKYKVEPEERQEQLLIKMQNESSDQILKENMEIVPAKYQLEITRPGYKTLREIIAIAPSEAPYVLTKTLFPAPRTVIFEVSSDYTKKIKGHKIQVSGKVVSSVVKIVPGQHSLTIEKEGYHSLKDHFKILASKKELKVLKRLVSKPRVVTYALFDSETNKNLTPKLIRLGSLPITGETLFKPNKYQLQIKVMGYTTIMEEIEIAPADATYHIQKRMSPSYRLVKYKIKGNFDQQLLLPKEITLNGEAVDGFTKFRPGSYDLALYVPGYKREKSHVVIQPGSNVFVIQQTLIAKKRKVVFNITGSFPKNIKLRPGQVRFNGKELLEGEEISPKVGGYQVEVQKAGYVNFSANVEVKPSENAFELVAQLRARSRGLRLQIDSDYRPTIPLLIDTLRIDGRKTLLTERIKPGKHTFILEKRGYDSLTFTTTVEAAETPYLIKKTLKSKSHPIVVKTISDFTGEQIQPQILKVNEKDLGSKVLFKPGVYELHIFEKGYREIRHKIKIAPSERPWQLTSTLVSKKRKVRPAITFDIAPGVELSPHSIRIRDIRNKSGFFRIVPGDELKPSEYQLTVEKQGYETFYQRLIIYPDNKDFKINAHLKAKYVQILFDIAHDVPALDKNYPKYKVTFIDVKTGIGRNVRHGNFIKPGNYLLDISQPGYLYKTPRTKITIAAGVKPYKIKEILYAQPRSISFGIYDDNIIKTHQLIIDGQIIKKDHKFYPGKKYNLIAKFHKYKTVHKQIEIHPGVGPNIMNIKLQPLKKYYLKLGRRFHGVLLDNIKYSLEMYADSERLEEHHINLEDVGPIVYYSFYAPIKMRSIEVAVAFYKDKSLVKSKFEFRDMREIDAIRLLEHLRELLHGSRPTQVIKRINRLLTDRQDKHKIYALPKAQLEKLINLLRE